MEQVGDELSRYRQRKNITRAELAKRLDVSTSTVAAWERGDRSPNPENLNRLRSLVINRTGSQEEQKDAPSTPAVPKIRDLPFSQLSPSDFENFYQDFLRCKFPRAQLVTRLGKSGHRQYGMDIVVIESGKIVFAVQCKREKSFGLSKAKQVIEKVEAEDLASRLRGVKKVLALALPSCSPQVSLFVTRHKDWTVWSGSNLSTEVRQLPKQQAIQLVDAYFPGYRDSFLGIRGPSVWETPSGVFDGPFNGPFSHAWNLVGCTKQLEQLQLQLDRPTASLSLVYGQGGMGKSRLLKELSVRASSKTDTFILASSGLIGANQFELLPPSGKIAVIIDDAHDRAELAQIVRDVWKRNQNAAIFLGLRTFAREKILNDLESAQSIPAEVCEVELDGLSKTEALQLARQAFGDGPNEHEILYFAQRTKDCPLSIVLGAHLVKAHKLCIADFAADSQIKDRILNSYVDLQVSSCPSLDPHQTRGFLEALALVQPLDVYSQEQMEVLTSLCEMTRKQVLKCLQELRRMGLVLRRKASHRIVPDLVGEMLLAVACFDEELGITTLFLERNMGRLKGESLKNAFINANRIELDFNSGVGTELPDKSFLWRWFEDEMASADARERAKLFSLLKDVAEFQPEQVLAIVEEAINNPVSFYRESNQAWKHLYPNGEILGIRELVPALRVVGHNLKYLQKVLNLLLRVWKRESELDGRRSEARKEVENLVGFEVGKNTAFNKRALLYILNFADFELPDSRYTLLTPLLSVACESTFFDERVLRIKSYPINSQIAEPLREVAVGAAVSDFAAADLKASGDAARFVRKALQRPQLTFGGQLSTEDSEIWQARFVSVLERLRAVMETDAQFYVKVTGLIGELNSHMRAQESAVSAAAEEFISRFVGLEEVKRTMVWHPNGFLSLFERKSHKEALAFQEEFVSGVVKGYENLETDEVFKDLQSRIRMMEEFHGRKAGGHQFTQKLSEAMPEVGALICQDFWLNTKDSVFSGGLVSSALLGLANSDWSAAVPLIGKLMEISDCRLEVVKMFSRMDFSQKELRRPLQFLTTASLSREEDIQIAVCSAATRLTEVGESEVAGRVVDNIRIDGSLKIAEALWEFHYCSNGFNEVGAFLELLSLRESELLDLPYLDSAVFESAISGALECGSNSTYVFLKKRIELWRDERRTKGRAFPVSLQASAGMKRDSTFWEILLELAEWMTTAGMGTALTLGVIDLASAVVGCWDEEVLRFIDTEVRSGNVEIPALLFPAPVNIAWRRSEETIAVLRSAEKQGRKTLELVEDALKHSASVECRTGSPGEPYPETLEQIEECNRLAHIYQDSECLERFYVELAAMGERDAQWEIEMDQRSDGRRW